MSDISKAASALRQTAEAAVGEAYEPQTWLWQTLLPSETWGNNVAVADRQGHPLAFTGEGEQAKNIANHMALMSPELALVLAEWLESVDRVLNRTEPCDAIDGCNNCNEPDANVFAAIALSNLINGAISTTAVTI
jgi:hypothetical protein